MIDSGKLAKTVLLCIIAEALNYITAYIFFDTLHIPLFMDTIFTVAITFYCGLVPGLVVGLCYNIIATLTLTIREYAFEPYTMLFGLCGAFVALVTWFFARRKEEFKISRLITILYLLLIALFSSFFSVITGGIIDYIRFTAVDLADRLAPVKNFTDSFLYQHFSLMAACILGQIPVSVTDRIITTFLGYGMYRVAVRLFGEEKW